MIEGIKIEVFSSLQEKNPDVLRSATELWMRDSQDATGTRDIALVDELQDTLSDPSISLLMVLDTANGAYVGFGIIEFSLGDHEEAEFGFAYVLPNYRRQGIFGLITQEVDKVARAKGVRRIYAYPVMDGRSLRVLERCGYLRIKEDDMGQVDLMKILIPKQKVLIPNGS